MMKAATKIFLKNKKLSPQALSWLKTHLGLQGLNGRSEKKIYLKFFAQHLVLNQKHPLKVENSPKKIFCEMTWVYQNVRGVTLVTPVKTALKNTQNCGFPAQIT